MNEDRFTVCADEYIRRDVNVDEAVELFCYYVGLGEWIGVVTRVTVTTDNSVSLLAWEYGRGLTFPRKEVAVGRVDRLPNHEST
jgi:hypothetical protein